MRQSIEDGTTSDAIWLDDDTNEDLNENINEEEKSDHMYDNLILFYAGNLSVLVWWRVDEDHSIGVIYLDHFSISELRYLWEHYSNSYINM